MRNLVTKNWILLALAGLALITAASTALAASAPEIRRFAVFVGRNDGGPGRPKLRYATQDAETLAQVMADLGGLDAARTRVLIEPSRATLAEALAQAGARVASEGKGAQRTELFFYYSGHSDEEGLLLGRERLPYPELKRLLARASSDVSVVILDSCASGAFTQVKGGVKRPPFLTDSLSKLRGQVVLTSASATESAQESERIKGSYFTHYLVSGLRGAADTSSDRKVTLNEAYQYAFHETLAGTERTLSGVQHPSYSIQLAGSGELVMTDVRQAGARLVLPKSLAGRVFVRDASDRMVAEVNKNAGAPLEVALVPGRYTLVLSDGKRLARAGTKLDPNRVVDIQVSDFEDIGREQTVARGEGDGEAVDPDEGYEHIPVEFGLWAKNPKLTTTRTDPDKTIQSFNLSLGWSQMGKLRGTAISLGATRALGNVRGAQISGFFNDTGGAISGAQISAGLNRARGYFDGFQVGAANLSYASMRGLQAGAFNRLSGTLHGAQFGFLNLAPSQVVGTQFGFLNSSSDVTGMQTGFANYAEDSVTGAQAGFVNLARDVEGMQAGAGNVAREKVRGIQIGLYNDADQVDGVQLGLVNVARSKDGVPIGLVNLAHEPIARLAYSFVDHRHHLAFKYGTRHAYSFVGAGVEDLEGVGDHALTAGLGFQIPFHVFYGRLESGYMNLAQGSFARAGGQHAVASSAALGWQPIDYVSVFVGLHHAAVEVQHSMPLRSRWDAIIGLELSTGR